MTDEIRYATYLCRTCGHKFKFELIKLLVPNKIMECPKCLIGTAAIDIFSNFTGVDKKQSE